MPFKSKAQQRWGHTEEGREALGGSVKVAEWDAATDESKLPARAKPKAARHRSADGKHDGLYDLHKV